MDTQEKIIAAAKPFIDAFRAGLEANLQFDVDKSNFTQEANGSRRVGRFLKLYIRYQKEDGKKASVLTHTIHEFTASQLEPTEEILKSLEAVLNSNYRPRTAAASAAPSGLPGGTAAPQVTAPVSTPIQTPPAISTPVAPPAPPPAIVVPPAPLPVFTPPPVIVAPPAPQIITAPPPVRFAPGSRVRVNTPGSVLNVRATPGLAGRIIAKEPDKTEGIVAAFAGNFDGYAWRGISFPDLGVFGFVADTFLVEM